MEKKNKRQQDQDKESEVEKAERVLIENPSFARWLFGTIGILLLLFVLPYALAHSAFFLREYKNVRVAVKDLKTK